MKTTVFIDGGYLRALGQKAGYRYTPDLIETVAVGCVSGEETLLRVLYYDCAPYTGDPPLPVSGAPANFRGSDAWLRELAAKPLFAVRLGTLKFRGFIAKRTPINPNELSDGDFKPRFEQKGVDMRLGLDIATHAMNGSVDRIILVTGDTDCLPAMKFARSAGLQVVLVELPRERLARELYWHCDLTRPVVWPDLRQDEILSLGPRSE